MTLGERILQKRKECGLSQENLGEKLDVTRQTVYKWESDQAVPDLDKLIRLAQIFGVRVGWLIAEEKIDQEEQLAKLLAHSQAMQPVRPDAGEIPEASARRKSNWLHCFAAATALVIAVAFSAVAFKLASIDRKIADLQSTNQCSQVSTSSQTEGSFTIADATAPSQPGQGPHVFTAVSNATEPLKLSQSKQEPDVFTVKRPLTVYSSPSKGARLVRTISHGETAEILRIEFIGGHFWGCVRYQGADGAELLGWIY